MRNLRVAVGQMPGVLGDVEANIDCAVELVRRADAEGARLLLLPESCLTGYAVSGMDRQATLAPDDDAFSPLRDAARETGVTVCAGFATAFEDGINVAHAVVRPDGELSVQRKAVRDRGEPEFLRPWPDATRTVFEVDGARVCIIICAEMGVPGVMDAVADVDPDLVLHPSAGHLEEEDVLFGDPDDAAVARTENEMRGIVEKTRPGVRDSGIPRAAANPIGYDGEAYWPGNSYIIDATGGLLLWLCGAYAPKRMTPSVAAADIPLRER